MVDRAWIVKVSDCDFAVQTNYAGKIAFFRKERASIQRGNEENDPYVSALAYLRALPRYGVNIDEALA